MADNKIYLAIGEETARGTKQSTTVGFIPLLSPGIPKLALDDKPRKEFRGEDSVKGDTAVRRMGQKWSASMETPFFTEAGGQWKGAIGCLIEHLFGHVTSTQNGATGQYSHMMYPVVDPFASANLGTKALTLNLNVNEGAVMRNWPYVGARVKSLSFTQEPGSHLKLGAELMGQRRDATTAEIGGAVYAAEGLRCAYNNLKVYTGTITRTGTAPDYTQFAFASATQIKPDKISVKIDNGMDDAVRLGGLDYPDKTRMGQFKVSLELTIDWEDPESGFSSVDDWGAWVAGASSTNFCLVWDTGTQAGTGDNHGLIIDVPAAVRMGGEPSYSLEKDPMITLKYEGLYDAAACKYMAGVMLKNTAATM
ncbi:MAG: hypothetical protein HY894_07910 [Deltaproteobacteria bacterium]|nr:hypothetical protein [Deltaproteobacteria bacterium]